MLSAVLLLGWDALVGYLYPGSRNPAAQKIDTPAEQVASSSAPHTRTGGLDPATLAIEKRDLKTALAGGGRIPIDSPRLAGSIANMTVVSTDGASSLTKNVASVLGEGQEVVRQLTGLDLSQLISNVAGGRATGASTDGTGEVAGRTQA